MSDGRATIIAAIIGAAAVIIAALIGVFAIVAPRPDAFPPPMSSPPFPASSSIPTASVVIPSPVVAAGRIASPSNNASVPIEVTVSGNAARVENDHQLRLFVEFIQDKRFFPGEEAIVLQPDSQWTGQINVGGPGQAAQQMKLYIADLGPLAIRKLVEYFQAERANGNVVGLSRNELDAMGVMFLDAVTVNRI